MKNLYHRFLAWLTLHPAIAALGWIVALVAIAAGLFVLVVFYG